MNIIGQKVLKDFSDKHSDVRSQIESWIAKVKFMDWLSPNDVKLWFGSASFLKDDVVVFNIKGNSYRLVTKIDYQKKIILILKIGTHAEYSKWKLE